MDARPEPTTPVRYIKLGRGGQWAERCLEHGEIRFGHQAVPHDLALSGDRTAIVTHLIAAGRSPGTAAAFAREILDFYELGKEALWVTFANGRLWWAYADPDVIWIGGSDAEGQRLRRTIGPWSDRDAKGDLLRQSSLSTKLTKVAAFRQTLCRISDPKYLLRRIAGEEQPMVLSATLARQGMVSSASDLIGALHWADFETFIDLVLARNGWHRVSALGGTQKDADLVVEQPVTGETAIVQVKSAANQTTLNDYVGRLDDNPTWTRLIFVCHSPRGSLDTGGRSDVQLWTRGALAELALTTGLFDWLVERAA